MFVGDTWVRVDVSFALAFSFASLRSFLRHRSNMLRRRRISLLIFMMQSDLRGGCPIALRDAAHRRPIRSLGLFSPWSQVMRGYETVTCSPQELSPASSIILDCLSEFVKKSWHPVELYARRSASPVTRILAASPGELRMCCWSCSPPQHQETQNLNKESLIH